MPAPRASLAAVAPSERRGPFRYPVAVEGVLASAEGPTTVHLTDISERGCQIQRLDGLTRDDSLRLSFAGFAPFDARVMWVSSCAAGLRFDYPAHSALIEEVVAAATGRQSDNRLLVSERVRSKQRERLASVPAETLLYVEDTNGAPRRGIVCTIREMSAEGCRIEADTPLAPGTAISVAMGERTPLSGIVRRSVGREIGIEFTAGKDQASAD